MLESTSNKLRTEGDVRSTLSVRSRLFREFDFISLLLFISFRRWAVRAAGIRFACGSMINTLFDFYGFKIFQLGIRYISPKVLAAIELRLLGGLISCFVIILVS